MRVFMTGASGYIGRAVVRQLRQAGHEVTGLVRSDAGAERLRAAGGEPMAGELTDLEKLKAGAAAAEGVIHLGFVHDFDNFLKSVEIDGQVIDAFGEALRGTDKPLLVTAGTAGRSEDEQPDPESHIPRVSEPRALALARTGINAGVIRLPIVHSRNDKGFLVTLIGIAREKGVSAYIGDGGNRWPSVYRDDAARVYRLALERAERGARYNAVAEEGTPFRDIAGKIGEKLGLPSVSVPVEQAAGHFGWMAPFAQMNTATPSRLTRERLGWTPTGPGLMQELENGTYFNG